MLKIARFLFSFPEKFCWEGQKTFSFFFFFLYNILVITNFEFTAFSRHKASCRARSPWVSCHLVLLLQESSENYLSNVQRFLYINEIYESM